MENYMIATLNTVIDDLYGESIISELREKNKEYIAEAIEEFGTLEEGLYEDIHDDISNCGRLPLACFIEHIQCLAILKEEKPEDYQTIIEYLAQQLKETI